MTSPSSLRTAVGLSLAIIGVFAGCRDLPPPTELAAIPPPSIAELATGNEQNRLDSAETDRGLTPTKESTHPGPEGRTPTTTTVRRPPATPTPAPPPVPSHDITALDEYQRGIAYVAIDNGSYLSADSDRSLDELFATGANYISLLVTWYQKDINSSDIHPTAATPSDDDLIHVIQYAHAHGVKVLLKPQLNFTDDPGHWRGEIAFASDDGWKAWFDSYLKFIMSYARLAQRNGVEEFSVGTELASASKHTANWRALIRAVRAEYSGLVTYSANHSGEEVNVQFWDDLDFIAVNNFYHLTNYRNPTVDQLLTGWDWPVLQLTRLHSRFPKQFIIFTEVGYPSLDRANIWPWAWYRTGGVNLQEQANCYEALFRTWWKNPQRPWFRGLFIWNWLTDPNQGGPFDKDYTPHGKPAEQILKKWFGGSLSASQ